MIDMQSTSAWHRAARNLAAICLLAPLLACTPSTLPTRPNVDARALEQRARAAAEAGNFAAAADLLTQLAAASTGVTRVDRLLEAAHYAARYGDNALARRRLAEARTGANREQQQRATALDAQLELAEGRPQAALDKLDSIQPPLADTPRQEAAAVRGQALFRLGRATEAVRILAERELWLNDGPAILANQRLIWDGFARNPPPPSTTPATGDSIIDGWLALAPAANHSGAELRRDLLLWRQSYPQHPAGLGLLADLLAAQRTADFPVQIALLLPLSSAQRVPALTIRDGFMAAYLEHPERSGTTVRVYDTTALGSERAYLSAQLDGADFIVGPLLRPEVDTVITQAGFVPTLTLNFASVDVPQAAALYQFALSPEDEGRAVAAAAAVQGAKTALVLVPSNARGYQIRDDFQAFFANYGGEVLDWMGYEPALQDFSQPISALLHVTRSMQRYRRLAANLGVPVQFPEGRRRQDVDMIFLVAEASPGRLLVPQLRFYSAGDIPTYATASIFDPATTSRESDLNGIIFADMPSLLVPDAHAQSLQSELTAFWPQRKGELRFYGMGFDAYQLIAAIYSGDPSAWPIRGMSGDLSLDTQGRVRRALTLAQFRNGRPVPIEQSIGVASLPAQGERPIGPR